MSQRGDIDYDLIRSAARQGDGDRFMMYTGASPVSGNISVFDSLGNLTDGGSPPSAIGQPQTPWLSNINAGQFQLTNASQINFQSAAAPVRSGYVNCNSAGMNIASGAGTALSISAVNQLVIGSNLSINSQASTPAGAAYTFGVSNAGVANAVAIYANGRVSIGLSTAPQYLLDLGGDVNTTGVYRVNGVPIGSGGQNQSPWLSDIQGAGFRLLNTSAIGVGTASPAFNLDVESAGDAGIRAYTTGGNVARLLLENYAAGGHNWDIRATQNSIAPAGGLSFTDNTAGAPRMVIDSNGNVGIGTNSPAATFEVIGQILSGGPNAMLTTVDRSDSTTWALYGQGSIARIWNTHQGDVAWLTNTGCMSLGTGTVGGDQLTIYGLGNSDYSQVRMAEGNYGVMLRNDGGAFYILLTNSGDPFGAWNGLRPFTIDLATGNVTIPSLVSNASIPSYYATMTGNTFPLSTSWQNMPGCVFTVNQTGRFLVLLMAEISTNGSTVAIIGLLINNGGPYGQQTFHYPTGGTMQVPQHFVVSASSGNQFTLAGYMSTGASAAVYPACTNITAIYLGP